MPGGSSARASDAVIPVFIQQDAVNIRPAALGSVGHVLLGNKEVTLRRTVHVHDAVLSKLGFELRRAICLESPSREQLSDGLIDELLVHLVRNYSTPAPHISKSKHTAQMGQVLDHISQEMGGKIVLDDLAQIAGLSKYHFSRQFTAFVGASPYQYILRSRVERAKYLLSQDDYTLASVAYICGFSDQSHFTRIFSQMTGSTPGHFRQIQQALLS